MQIIDGKDCTKLPCSKRPISYLIQNPQLGQKKAHSYIASGLGKYKPDNLTDTIKKTVEKLNIEPLLNRRPTSLSGGERQLIALAKALISKAPVLLLDEPFSAMDVESRSRAMELLLLLKKEGKTILHITHDFYEIYSIADRIGIIQDGRLIQEGPPEDIRAFPSSEFVEKLIATR